VGTPPVNPIISDFSDAAGGGADTPILFGAPPNIAGATFSYAAPGLMLPVLSIGQGLNGSPALRVEAHPGPAPDPGSGWFGFGLSFAGCVDATAYDAVRFTIGGPSGLTNCAIRFAVTSSETVKPLDDPRGTCTAPNCYPPSTPIIAGGTLTVPFRSIQQMPGSPDVVDPRSFIGIQWQMDTTPVGCDGSFTIDDITFVNTRTGPTGAGGAGGAGGTAGSGGGPSGTGGTGSRPPVPLTCGPTAANGPSIADFTDTFGNSPAIPTFFGTPPALTGRTFGLSPPGLNAAGPPFQVSIGSPAAGNKALTVLTRSVSQPGLIWPWSRVGLIFDSCIDATPFAGVRFTISVMNPSCPIDVGFVSRQNFASVDDVRGTCAMGSCPPSYTPVVLANSLPASVTVPFAGSDVDPMWLMGIEWRIPITCSTALWIDDIAFVNQ